MKDFILRVRKYIFDRNQEIRRRYKSVPDFLVFYGVLIFFAVFFLFLPSLSVIVAIILFAYLLYLEGASFILAIYTSAQTFFRGIVIIVALLAISSLIFTVDESRFLEVDYTFEELNKKGEYIEAIKMDDSFIKVKDDDCKSYKIKLRKDKLLYEQPFDLMSYTRKISDIEGKDKIEWEKLCKNFENGNKGMPTSFLVEDIENKKTLSMLANLFSELKRSTGKISVYIKGYADAQNDSWQRKLDSDFDYSEIRYYKADDFFKTSYTIDDGGLIVHSVPQEKFLVKPGFYGNADLPFLRAN